MTDLDLEGVSAEKRESAEKELRSILRMFFGSEDPESIKSLIIAEDFASKVHNLSPRGEERKYNPVHGYGVAIAKTIPILEDNTLKFHIIIDGKICGTWMPEQYLWRLGIIGHELLHVHNDLWRSKTEGISWLFTEPSKKYERLYELAWIIWGEYFCEKSLGEAFFTTAKELGGHVTFDATLGHLETLKEHLVSLRSYLAENIRKFRKWKYTAEDILSTNGQRVLGILMLLAYVYPISEFDPLISDKVSEIENTDGYREFISKTWPTIHNILRRIYEEKDYDKAKQLLNQVASEIDKTLVICGLEIKDTEKGWWLEVHDI